MARTRVLQQLKLLRAGFGRGKRGEGVIAFRILDSRQTTVRLGEESDKEFNMLGRVFYAWREKEGLTIREAAKMIGLSYSTLSRIENGMSVDGRTLKKLLIWLLQDDADT